MDGWDKVYKIIVDRDTYKEDLETAQAEIDELVDMLENMVFNANLHHNDAVELLHKYKGE